VEGVYKALALSATANWRKVPNLRYHHGNQGAKPSRKTRLHRFIMRTSIVQAATLQSPFK
jgi:hypothetical protein